MKTKLTLKIFKVSTLATITIAVVVASLTQSAMAQNPHQLVFTENSGSLSATFDGAPLSVSPVATEQWNVFVPYTLNSASQVANWIEPENSSLVNWAADNGTTRIGVKSDTANFGAGATVSNGTPVSFGIDANDNVPVQATFNDNGGEASVPDTGSTLALLALALAALIGASRFRALRLA